MTIARRKRMIIAHRKRMTIARMKKRIVFAGGANVVSIVKGCRVENQVRKEGGRRKWVKT
jgi:hypothetical protein